MQSGIALGFFILLKLCDAHFYRSCLFLYGICWPWWFLWPLGLETIRETAHRAQTSLRRYQPALQSAMVEFHKAQCFFMLAIGTAGQIVLRQRSLEDANLQSLVNYTLISLISMNGVLPIIGTLLCLHTVHMHSLYLLILSVCTIVLSTVTLFKSQKFVPSPQDISTLQAATDTRYPNCGNRDPSVYCLAEAYGEFKLAPGGPFAGVGTVIFSLVLLGLLVLDYGGLQELIIAQRILKKLFGGVESLLKRNLPLLFPHSRLQRALREITAQKIVNAWSNILYFFIWMWFILNFVVSCNELSTFSPVPGWSFGQIVAITVWAAPLIEFAKLLVRK